MKIQAQARGRRGRNGLRLASLMASELHATSSATSSGARFTQTAIGGGGEGTSGTWGGGGGGAGGERLGGAGHGAGDTAGTGGGAGSSTLAAMPHTHNSSPSPPRRGAMATSSATSPTPLGARFTQKQRLQQRRIERDAEKRARAEGVKQWHTARHRSAVRIQAMFRGVRGRGAAGLVLREREALELGARGLAASFRGQKTVPLYVHIW